MRYTRHAAIAIRKYSSDHATGNSHVGGMNDGFASALNHASGWEMVPVAAAAAVIARKTIRLFQSRIVVSEKDSASGTESTVRIWIVARRAVSFRADGATRGATAASR